jgi:hypothetical protein
VKSIRKELYLKFRKQLYEISKEVGAKFYTIGNFSNKQVRPLIKIGNGERKLLIVAGEDIEEYYPALEIPWIIKEISKRNYRVETMIMPIFDILHLSDLTRLNKQIKSYEDLRTSLKDSYIYSKKELISKLKENLLGRVDFYVLEGLTHVQEALFNDKYSILGIKSDDNRLHLNSIVYALFDELPFKFYVPLYKDDLVKTFFKIPLKEGSRIVSYYRPIYGCFDLSPLPEEVKEIKDVAEKCDFILLHHCYQGEKFFLFSYNSLPLARKIVSKIESAKLSVKDEEELKQTPFNYMLGAEKGIVLTSHTTQRACLDDLVDKSIATEIPFGLTTQCTRISTMECVKYYSNLER